jgi:hypothetical protein
MKYAVEMGSGAMIYEYISGFIKDWFRYLKFVSEDTHTHKQTNKDTHTQQRDLISILYFFKISKVG